MTYSRSLTTAHDCRSKLTYPSRILFRETDRHIDHASVQDPPGSTTARVRSQLTQELAEELR